MHCIAITSDAYDSFIARFDMSPSLSHSPLSPSLCPFIGRYICATDNNLCTLFVAPGFRAQEKVSYPLRPPMTNYAHTQYAIWSMHTLQLFRGGRYPRSMQCMANATYLSYDQKTCGWHYNIIIIMILKRSSHPFLAKALFCNYYNNLHAIPTSLQRVQTASAWRSSTFKQQFVFVSIHTCDLKLAIRSYREN